MTKKIHYVATMGTATFERHSHRTYTHCVVSPQSIAADRARLEEGVRFRWDSNLTYYQNIAKGRPSPGYHYDVSPAMQEEGARMLALGKDGLVAECLAKFDAEHAGKDDRYFRLEGWCGRPDLAAKLAAKAERAIILTAEVRT